MLRRRWFAARTRACRIAVLLLVALGWTGAVEGAAASPTSGPAAATKVDEPRYTYNPVHDPNGTGKFYMGREIAQVMGHEAIRWLDRRQREREETAALKLNKGDVVADIGAGSGYITTRLARAVGPEGRVKAVDIQPEMLDALEKKLGRARIRNVDLVLGEEADPKLAASSVDLVLMVDVYHEFEFPYEMMQATIRSLRPGGRVVLVEYRKEDPAVPIKLVHKMTAAQAIAEMNSVGLQLKEKIDTLSRQHILIFEQPAALEAANSRPAD
jgi:ubiquinone/menaquinone biosynthesis C-methylase UbiE